ncbi:MAG TPA: DUF308 domain-containing protein [Methanomicrobiales archaeon]|nr:DUF308 domain-containing protein [Methanomicrobiales archaeon]
MTETVGADTSHVKWSSFVLVGILAIIVGILVLLWPDYAVVIATILFGILLIIASVQALVLGFATPIRPVGLILMGFLGLILGVIAILFPWNTAVAATLVIALLMMFFGFIEIAIAIFHPEFTSHRVMLCLTGALSVILGGIYLFLPRLGAMVIVAVYLGFFSILYGILGIYIGFQVKGEMKKMKAA